MSIKQQARVSTFLVLLAKRLVKHQVIFKLESAKALQLALLVSL